MSESRLILVDGSGYIFRAYYALPPMNNSKGIPTNAVYGFCNMMLRLIDEHPNDKILIKFMPNIFCMGRRIVLSKN